MLGEATLVAFIATADPQRAKNFYATTLGCRLVSDDQFALVFDCHGTPLRIQKLGKLQPQPFTALGWRVTNIRAVVAALSRAGVSVERYPFLTQDEVGVWLAPSGTRVAWF